MNNGEFHSRSEIRRSRKKPKKPFYQRVWFMILVAFIALIVFTAIFSPKDTSNKKSDNKTEQTTKSYSKVNKSISSKLKEDKGFADGTLDENGRPTNDGTPNTAFAWSKYVVKIKQVDSNRIDVHVTTEFGNLSNSNKSEVALKSQNVAMQGMAKHKKLSNDDYQEGIYTVVYRDGDNTGRSKMSNFKEFKWNK